MNKRKYYHLYFQLEKIHSVCVHWKEPTHIHTQIRTKAKRATFRGEKAKRASLAEKRSNVLLFADKMPNVLLFVEEKPNMLFFAERAKDVLVFVRGIGI